MIGLSQTKAADPITACEWRQILLPLRLCTELEDRQHHERALHAHHRAIARIDPLDFARDQPVTDIAQARTPIGLRNGRTEQAQFAHFPKNTGINRFMAELLKDPRAEPVLSIGLSGIAHGTLIVA